VVCGHFRTDSSTNGTVLHFPAIGCMKEEHSCADFTSNNVILFYFQRSETK
jgi:hypothetical protein